MDATTMTKNKRGTLLRRPAVLATGLLVAGAAALAVALGGGSSSGGIGPAAALAQATDATASVASGVAHATTTFSNGAKQEVVVRFDGDDVDATYDQITEENEIERHAVRSVGGKGYELQSDGSWKELEGTATSTAAAAVRDDVRNQALFDAVKASDSLTQDGDVYRAQLTAEQVGDLDNALLAVDQVADGVTVEVTARDGLISVVSLEAGGVKRSITYSELGEPQEITAPDTAPTP